MILPSNNRCLLPDNTPWKWLQFIIFIICTVYINIFFISKTYSHFFQMVQRGLHCNRSASHKNFFLHFYLLDARVLARHLCWYCSFLCKYLETKNCKEHLLYCARIQILHPQSKLNIIVYTSRMLPQVHVH